MKQQQQLIKSLHRSIEHIVSTFKLIKAVPPSLDATSLLEYAQLIQNLLKHLLETIPKLCVPMALFKKLERESVQNGQMLDRCLKQQRKVQVQIGVLQQRLKQSEEREASLKQSYQQILRNNNYYKKKAQSLKKSGEQSIKNVLEVVSSKQQDRRMSLPRLDKKEKLSLLWLIGPTSSNDKLINHLINKP